MATAPPAPSVWERVLRAQFDDLDPRLRPYFAATPDGFAGEGRGTFDTAGSRVRVLRPLLAWMARHEILFPEIEADVPFTIVNTPSADGSLGAVRTFRFTRGDRIVSDRISVVDGRLVDRIGRGGRLEVVLGVQARTGGMRLRSQGLAVHVAGRRIPLPPVVRVTVDERFAEGLQHVDVRLRSPLIGEVFRYAGTFTYSHVRIERSRG